MTKKVLYKYLGTNGVIVSPVHLEDIYYIRQLQLFADPGKVLVNGKITRKVVTIPEEELEDWAEVDELGQN